MALICAWVGANTSDGATVVCQLDGAGEAILVVSEDPGLTSPVESDPVTADADDVAKLVIAGLDANTQYYWGVKHDTVLDGVIQGSFKTLPTPGLAASFTVAAGCCAGTPITDPYSNHEVFDKIRTVAPLLFMHMGDLNYDDPSGSDPAVYAATYPLVLAESRQHECWRNVPITFVWDNHDTDGVNFAASRTAYEQWVPHRPLSDATAVYQSFAVGRVRFILLDVQTYRSHPTTMIGATQKAWLKAELLAATERVIVLSTGNQWIGDTDSPNVALSWASCEAERQELAEFFEDNDLTHRLLIIAGDMHALAMDDGSNSQFDPDATTLGPPVAQLGALDQGGGSDQSAGTYSYGPQSFVVGTGQYGIITIADDGTDVVVTVTGYRYNQTGPVTSVIYQHSVTVRGNDAGPDTYTVSIGATGRDYATITAFIAALAGKAIGTAGDHIIGELYNDAVFNETVTVLWEPGWYGSVTIRPAAGQRHTGIAGTGARLVRTAAGTVFDIQTGKFTLEGVEVDGANFLSTNQRLFTLTASDGGTALVGGGPVTLNGVIGHGMVGSTGGRNMVFCAVTAILRLLNSVFYDFELTVSSGNAQTAVNITANSAIVDILNCVVDRVHMSAGTGAPRGVVVTNQATKTIRNTVVTRVTTGGSGTPSCFVAGASAIQDHNASDDATAIGTGSLTSITPADQFVSLTAGAQDFHLKAGASLINAGTDLGTEPAGVNLDLDGRDRDAEGDVWDIGADELVAAPEGVLLRLQHEGLFTAQGAAL